MNRNGPRFRAVSVCTLISVLLYLVPAGPFANRAWSTETGSLKHAQELFLFANYEEALVEVDLVLANQTASGPDIRRDSYVLRGRCLRALGRESEATDAFCQALLVDPAWKPDPLLFQQVELEFIESVRLNCPEPEPPGSGGEPPLSPTLMPERGPSRVPIYISGTAALILAGLFVAQSKKVDDRWDRYADSRLAANYDDYESAARLRIGIGVAAGAAAATTIGLWFISHRNRSALGSDCASKQSEARSGIEFWQRGFRFGVRTRF